MNMEYPKKVMRRTELLEMGFPEELLDRAYREKGQTFAQKINPTKRNSAIVFDTAGFERWRLKQIQVENRSLQRGCGVM